jgi:hypothetical protein
MNELPDRIRVQEHNLPDFQERARSLGLSLNRARFLLKVGEDYDPSTHNERHTPMRVLSDTHHMTQPSGKKWYFKYVSKGINISKPLSLDVNEAKAMRDELLKQYGYTKE